MKENKLDTVGKHFFENAHFVVVCPNKKNNVLLAIFMNSLVFDYHSDWNRLMSVVDKIENVRKDKKGYNDIVAYVRIESNTCEIAFVDKIQEFAIFWKCDTRIEAVYTACIEFVEWYNKNIKP